MLKLSYSFYRYLMVTSEKYSHFSGIHKPSVSLILKRSFYCNNFLYKKSKKKPHFTGKMNPNQNPIRLTPFVICSEEVSDTETNSTTEQKGSNATPKPPDCRIWERAGYCYDSPPTFKIVSYNVLANHLMIRHQELYDKCAPRDLDWTQRSVRLLNEMTALDADILCLQEVETKHLPVFKSRFALIGYDYIFKAKTGQGKDGCAIFYKKHVFTVQDICTVEFYQPDFPLLNRDNIGILVKLVHKDKPEIPLVIATTHLLYNPRRADIKLAQMKLFLAEIDRFAYYVKGNVCGYHPIIVTGDLNSEPASEVVKLLNDGSVCVETLLGSCDWERIGVTDNCQHLQVALDRQAGRMTDFRKLKIHHSERGYNSPRPQTTEQPKDSYSVLFNTDKLCQSLELTSVYADSTAVTTFQEKWTMVDYIYYSRLSNLRLLKRLRLPSAEDEFLRPLPNGSFASDHLALGAVFQIICTPSAASR